MNRPAKIPLPVNAPAGTIGAQAASAVPVCQTGEAGAPNLSTYSYRTTDCEECNGNGEVGGYVRVAGEGYECEPVAWHCQDCNGSGEQDAACAECNIIVPLNDLGLCERCHDANELPLQEFAAKHYPHLEIGQ
jgi:hypothetical protein